MAPRPEIRRASADDRTAVLATVVAAFVEDPAWAFLTDGHYSRLAPLLAGALFDLRVGSGDVWVSRDLAAVAMWSAPGGSGGSRGAGELIWKRYRSSAGARAWARLDAYNRAVVAASSPGPHWYLGTLATHPARQARGLAGAVIEPVLERAERDGCACCLETSTQANRRFYEHRGFTVVSAVDVPSGPPTWWLRRDARPARAAARAPRSAAPSD